MDKNISNVKIEIGGKEYTLFMNRTGLVNWESLTKLQEKGKKYENQLKEFNGEVTDDTNPFEMYTTDDFEEKMDETENETKDIYLKFYWIALYTHQKLSLDEVRKLFDKAIEEYGFQQLADLAMQIIEDMNTNKVTGELKNLKALRPKN